MIRGLVESRRAWIRLVIVGPLGQAQVECVLDTGFTGVLTLPLSACEILGLPFRRRQTSHLANRSVILSNVFLATD